MTEETNGLKQRGTVADAMQWVKRQGDHGYVAKSTASDIRSALSSLCDLPNVGEDYDARKMRQELDNLFTRYIHVKGARKETTSQYIRRARRGLDDYLTFLEDAGHTMKRLRDLGDNNGKKKKPKKKSETTETQTSQPAMPDEAMRFPLPGGRRFVCYWTGGYFTEQDAERMAQALRLCVTPEQDLSNTKSADEDNYDDEEAEAAE